MNRKRAASGDRFRIDRREAARVAGIFLSGQTVFPFFNEMLSTSSEKDTPSLSGRQTTGQSPAASASISRRV